MHGVAWLLNDLVFNNLWAGFFVEAGLFLLIGAGAGLFAWRSFKRGAPPTPEMAIEEAKEIKAAFDGRTDRRKDHEHPQPARRSPTRGNGRWTPPPPGDSFRRADPAATSSSSARSSPARWRPCGNRWVQVTDVRRQIREHKTELAVGAAVVGFLVGGAIALPAAARR